MEDKPKQKRSPKRKSEDCHWTCKYCNKEFRIRRDLENHLKICKSKPLPRIWKCDECGEVFPTRSKLGDHKTLLHYKGYISLSEKIHIINSEIIEKECPFCHKILRSNRSGCSIHINHCESNPDRKIFKGHPISEETRKKISESMKIAQKEGRAHNINECIIKGEKSYPEKWMTSVIENEFNDKDYAYNLKVGKYKLDFAWPKKMRYIEIDGDQHYTEYCIAKDKRRTEYLTNLGWTLLRRSWSCISRDKLTFIDEAKRFIDDAEDLPPEAQYRDKRKEQVLNKVSEKVNKSVKLDKIPKVDETKLRLQSMYPQLFGSNGCYLKVSVNEYLRRRDLILNSGVDMTKSRWKSKVAKITGLHKRWIDGVIEKFPDDFKDTYNDAHLGKTIKSGG